MGRGTDIYFKCTNVIHVLSVSKDSPDLTLAKAFAIMGVKVLGEQHKLRFSGKRVECYHQKEKLFH